MVEQKKYKKNNNYVFSTTRTCDMTCFAMKILICFLMCIEYERIFTILFVCEINNMFFKPWNHLFINLFN